MRGPFRSSAPGSIMVTGEHAVVYGHPAMVCAIEQRIDVDVTPRNDRKLHIVSGVSPPLSFYLDELPDAKGPLRFVIAALEMYKDQMEGGAEFDIRSAIDPTLGLGSSAAVTIAMLGALQYLSNGRVGEEDLPQIHHNALHIIRTLQGRGSGADLAASLYGGLVEYRLPAKMVSAVPHGEHAEITPLPLPPPLYLSYCGYKTPTAEVLATIATRMAGREAAYDLLYQEMGAVSRQAIEAARVDDWQTAAAALNDYQRLMAELGVTDRVLDQLVAQGRSVPGVLAAKISGSGLGDCVLAVGEMTATSKAGTFKPVTVAQAGLTIGENL